MAKPLTVKAILQYPEGLELGCSPDVRRFKLPTDGGSDLYHCLQETILTIFPDVKGLKYSLFWKDDDGDLNLFSTKEELQLAIDAMQDHLLRVYIIVDFDQGTEETDSETEDTSTHAELKRASRKFRRRVRRRRRNALGDSVVISKEYRTGARVLTRRLHDVKDESAEIPKEAETALAGLPQDVKDFIQQVNEEWHAKLATQRPKVAARRMRMKKRTLPEGLERDHFLWLCRFLGRWHRRHAGLCKAMANWSSGETGDDSSGDEETILKKIEKKRVRRVKKERKQETAASASEPENEDETSDHKVPKEFRSGVRLMLRKLHKKTDGKGEKPASEEEKATLAALTPETQAFIQKMVEDWHTMLSEKRPRVVAKRMRKKKSGKSGLPSGMGRAHYLWVCRLFNRWHKRNAQACPFMSGWSSGEGDDVNSEDEGKTAEGLKKKDKRKGIKGNGAPDASDSSDDEQQEKRVVPKEFVKAVRILTRRFHKKQKKEELNKEEQADLAAISAETQTFVNGFLEEWDSMLGQKPPRVVARRMRKKTRTLPAGVENKEVRFLCRFLGRWYGKQAVNCAAMAAWSSAESGEASVDERSPVRCCGKPGPRETPLATKTKEKGQ